MWKLKRPLLGLGNTAALLSTCAPEVTNLAIALHSLITHLPILVSAGDPGAALRFGHVRIVRQPTFGEACPDYPFSPVKTSTIPASGNTARLFVFTERRGFARTYEQDSLMGHARLLTLDYRPLGHGDAETYATNDW